MKSREWKSSRNSSLVKMSSCQRTLSLFLLLSSSPSTPALLDGLKLDDTREERRRSQTMLTCLQQHSEESLSFYFSLCLFLHTVFTMFKSHPTQKKRSFNILRTSQMRRLLVTSCWSYHFRSLFESSLYNFSHKKENINKQFYKPRKK